MFLYVDPQPVSFTLALGHKHILRASADVHALENVYYPYIVDSALIIDQDHPEQVAQANPDRHCSPPVVFICL